jgi:transcriptional regulator with XRE-family HTH domain
MTFGERLKSLRRAKGWTQMQVAVAAGLSLSIVSQLEQQDYDNPTLATMRKLASALGCSLDDLGREDVGEEAPEVPPAGKRRRDRGKG